jgi:uncharacterized protein (DUF305 family)
MTNTPEDATDDAAQDVPAPEPTPDPTTTARSTTRTRLMAVVAVVTVLLVGLYGQSLRQTAPTPTATAPITDEADSRSRMSMHELHHGGAGTSPTSESAYLVDMIPHHIEAIRAARQLLAGTEREDMRGFAREIIRVQQAEVETMRFWLAERHPDVDTSSSYSPMMRDYEGMTGDELDRAFLDDMIPHHMTAVMMSRQLVQLRLAEHDDVNPFAETIAATQGQEIQQMTLWLTQWFGADAGYSMGMHG